MNQIEVYNSLKYKLSAKGSYLLKSRINKIIKNWGAYIKYYHTIDLQRITCATNAIFYRHKFFLKNSQNMLNNNLLHNMKLLIFFFFVVIKKLNEIPRRHILWSTKKRIVEKIKNEFFLKKWEKLSRLKYKKKKTYQKRWSMERCLALLTQLTQYGQREVT